MNDIEMLIKRMSFIEEGYLNNGHMTVGNFNDIDKAIELLKERQADKDRIKEKIEWLREISDNGANAVRFAATHDDEIERMQKQKDISTMIGILQELLKESD